jgi:hypothetical protein
MALIEESTVGRYSRKARVGLAQLSFSPFDSLLEQPLMGRDSGCLFERLGKIAWGKTALDREVENGRIAVQMGIEEFVDASHLPWSEARTAIAIGRLGVAIPYDNMLAESEGNVIDK